MQALAGTAANHPPSGRDNLHRAALLRGRSPMGEKKPTMQPLTIQQITEADEALTEALKPLAPSVQLSAVMVSKGVAALRRDYGHSDHSVRALVQSLLSRTTPGASATRGAAFVGSIACTTLPVGDAQLMRLPKMNKAQAELARTLTPVIVEVMGGAISAGTAHVLLMIAVSFARATGCDQETLVSHVEGLFQDTLLPQHADA